MLNMFICAFALLYLKLLNCSESDVGFVLTCLLAMLTRKLQIMHEANLWQIEIIGKIIYIFMCIGIYSFLLILEMCYLFIRFIHLKFYVLFFYFYPLSLLFLPSRFIDKKIIFKNLILWTCIKLSIYFNIILTMLGNVICLIY